jgi:hypothetical protein
LGKESGWGNSTRIEHFVWPPNLGIRIIFERLKAPSSDKRSLLMR